MPCSATSMGKEADKSELRHGQLVASELAMLAHALEELAAIRGTVARAADDILGSAEALLDAPSPNCKSHQDAMLSIVAACGFHDLVGQRAAKIQEIIDKIIAARVQRLKPDRGHEAERRPRGQSKLSLSGPALPPSSADQSSIDALFLDA